VLIMVIVISTYAIFQFLLNMFNFLLYKIRKNIGTLKAFGITVSKLYITLLCVFVYSGIIIVMVSWSIIGLPLINKFISPSFSFFSTSWEIFFFLLPFLTISGGLLRIIYKTRKEYFNQSPGDLIYDRINEK
jgi:hypothetical protein